MAERVPQSVAYLWVFRAFLASDGKTPATGKTIAVTISKNGGAFGNPNAGALNATEISSGFYKASLDTTDTGTLGPLAVRGAEGTINDAGDVLNVTADSATWTAIKTKTDFLPSVTAGAAGGVFIAGTNAATSVTTALTANITGNLSGSVGSVTGAVGSVTGAVGSVTGSVGSIASGGIAAASFAAGAINAAAIATDAIDNDALAANAVTEIQSGLATAAALTTVEGKIDTLDTNVDAILVDTGTDIPASVAALPTAIENADALFVRDSSNWEASAPLKSLGVAVMKAVHKIAPTGSDLIIYRSDGTTAHAKQALTTDATLEPIKDVGAAITP